MSVSIKRVYDGASESDGVRVLVDRVWPRGIAKADAQVDQWLREVGPSTSLRQWFGHDPDKFDEFARRYRHELEDSDAFADLKKIVHDNPNVTLVYSAKDTQHNQAVVLRDVLATS